MQPKIILLKLQKKLSYGYHIASHPELVIVLASFVFGFLSSYLLLMQDQNSLLYYSDSMSHLVISRRVFDWITPGIVQLGSVWLPMTHLMLIPFVTNNFLFHSGRAGTMVSTVSM